MTYEIQDFINDLENASSMINDVMRELEDYECDADTFENNRSAYISIIRILLKNSTAVFDEDDPQELLDILTRSQEITTPNIMIAFAQGYKAAVSHRDYLYYVRRLRETIAQQEKEDAAKNQDSTDSPGLTS
jgi:hypothetical protein